jgi:hypothetical protein
MELRPQCRLFVDGRVAILGQQMGSKTLEIKTVEACVN